MRGKQDYQRLGFYRIFELKIFKICKYDQKVLAAALGE